MTISHSSTSAPLPTPSGEAPDLREAVARTIRPSAFACTPALYGLSIDDHQWRQSFAYGAQQVALVRADAIIAEHIAPLRAENESLRAERDEFKAALEEMVATIDPTIDLIQRQRSWQAYGERLERDADSALADEIQTQRKRVVEMKAQVEGARADLAAAIARAEVAERDRDIANTANEALEIKLEALAPHGSCACSYDRPDDVCMHHSPALVALTAELAQVKEQVAGMRERASKVMAPFAACVFDDNFDVTLSTGRLADRDWVDIERFHRALTTPEHPHGD